MTAKIEQELYHALNLYQRAGGKKHRANQAHHMRRILTDIIQHEGITSIYQLGRKHISSYWRRNQHHSELTKRDEFYALNYVWRNILGRQNPPPK